MAKQLSKQDIVTRKVVRPWHVSQSVDAFTGIEAYDITISGSLTLTGSLAINGLTTTSQANVLTIDSSTGQVYYTASSAVGGGGGGGGGGGLDIETITIDIYAGYYEEISYDSPDSLNYMFAGENLILYGGNTSISAINLSDGSYLIYPRSSAVPA